jgi:hypothetical protein
MDRPDDDRPNDGPADRPFAALDDDDEAPAGADGDAPVVTAAPLAAGMTGGPPGTLGTPGGATTPETKDPDATT